MSVTLEFDFDQIVGLARQLSPKERTRLVQELHEVGGEAFSVPFPDSAGTGLVRKVVSTGNPIFTPEDFERFRKNGERLRAPIYWEQAERNRRKLLQNSLEWPVATEEEIEMQNQIRGSIEPWRL